MKIRYSTNWMGPVTIQWYRDRGLTAMVSKFIEEDSPFIDEWKAGSTVEVEMITEQYAGGRIDVHDGSAYGDEIGLPPMHINDWRRFSKWLDTVETDDTWTLDQLVERYELSNPKITWSK